MGARSNAPAERFFAGLVLFLFTDALLPLMRREAGVTVDLAQGDRVSQMIWLGVYGVTFLLAAIHWRVVVRSLFQGRQLILLVAIALASALWSVAPAVTVRRGIALVGTTLFGVYFAARFTLSQQIRILAGTLATIAVLSLVVALAMPWIGVSSGVHEGAWRGIFVHKNILGRIMALSAIVWAISARQAARGRMLAHVMLALSVLLVFLSRSTTGMLMLAAVGAALAMHRLLRLHYTLMLSLAIFAGLLGVAAVAWLSRSLDLVFALLQKEPTLTGRTILWAVVLERIWRNPLLGYGYGAFWLGPSGESRRVWDVVGWDAPHAHQGYLDLLLDVGGIGAFIFLAGFASAFVRASALVRRRITNYWPVAYLTFMLAYNFAESAILRQNSIFWTLYVSLVVQLAMYARAPSSRQTLAAESSGPTAGTTPACLPS